jgi:putative heme transporter
VKNDSSASIPGGLRDELIAEELGRADAKRRKGRKRLIGGGVAAVVIGVVFAFVLPRIADYKEVWHILSGVTSEWMLGLAVAVVLNVVTSAPPWMAALPGLGFLHALRVTQASTALSMVAPGGAAVGMATSYAMLNRWGLKDRAIGLAVLVTGVWNQLAIFGFPIIAVAALVANGGSSRTLEWVALIGLIVFTVIVAGFAVGLQSARLARKLGNWAAGAVSWVKHLANRGPVRWTGETFVRFREEAIELLRRRWHVLTLGVLANHLTVFVLMVFCLRAVGITRAEVDIVEAFAAWSLVRVLGSIPITPGGLGIVELGLTGMLVGFGASNGQAVAATVLYRVLGAVPTLALGLLAAVTWKLRQPKTAAA